MLRKHKPLHLGLTDTERRAKDERRRTINRFAALAVLVLLVGLIEQI